MPNRASGDIGPNFSEGRRPSDINVSAAGPIPPSLHISDGHGLTGTVARGWGRSRHSQALISERDRPLAFLGPWIAMDENNPLQAGGTWSGSLGQNGRPTVRDVGSERLLTHGSANVV
jgi:hypothetical protein